jgi:oligoendopeptidase F
MQKFLSAFILLGSWWPLNLIAETTGGNLSLITEPLSDPGDVWDLTGLFPTPETWDTERQRILAALPNLAARAGTLNQGPAALQGFLDEVTALRKATARLSVYASLQADEDLRVAPNLERRSLAQQLGSEFARATSWFTPELLALGDERVRGWIDSTPSLADYRFPLERSLRNRPHTLGTEAEAVLAASGLATGTGGQVHGILTNSDIPWPKVTLSTGEEVTLNASGYARHRAAPARADRKLVFDAFWGAYRTYENTFGTTFNGMVQADLFRARARNYDSSLTAALSPNRIPETVYQTLVAEVNTSLPTLHRYFKLRARLLGVEQPHYYDIYPAMVGLDKPFPFAEARRLTLVSAAPLGADYLAKLRHGLTSPWTHVYPATGKRSGAYMSGGAFDAHPYVLMNYRDDYDSVSTLAHEWGHAVHTMLANEAQPYPVARYSIYTAEIASIVNEILLLEHMLQEAETDDERLYYLGAALEGMRGTYFRQAMFAEFEARAHGIVAEGGAISGRRLTALYGEILKRYHGHDEGVLTIDDAYALEWAYIPHFYNSFYVYQYATSLAAANLFADRILANEADAVETYLNLLKAGGADDPHQLVLAAGVDLASPAPYQATARRMNAIMDQMEAILAKREN